MLLLDYQPEKTALQFHNDRDTYPFRFIRGVPGSGKTVMCLQEMLLWAIDQPPGHDKIRRTRFGIIRATYPQLNSTTIKTYENWYPPELWPVKKSIPYASRVKFGMKDGTQVDMEVIFLALETEVDEKKLKSLELTGGFINEMFEVDRSIVTTLFERTGRYPPSKFGAGCKRNGVWGDTNSPMDDHWYAKDERNPPEGWKFYAQPAPLIRRRDSEGRTVGWDNNPQAENIINLGGGNIEKGYDYYRKQLPGLREDKIKVNIENKFGSIFTGKPVYEVEWDDNMVASKPIDVVPGHPVYIGMDTSGLHPSAIFAQEMHGSLVLLDEVVAFDTAFDEFVESLLMPLITKKYSNKGIDIEVCGDPSDTRNAKTGTTPLQDLMRKQLRVFKAPTNDPVLRVNAVKFFLNRRNGLIVDPRMAWLINGFKGGYSFSQIAGTRGRYKDVPDKNKFSHPHDGLQYLCLHLRRAFLNDSPTTNSVIERYRGGHIRTRASQLV